MQNEESPHKPLLPEESYIQRRELFKNIWKTAMRIDPNVDIFKKPKIIKTLRMDDLEKCPVGHTKKERIKNLRHVCNKILDFCDKQESGGTRRLRTLSPGLTTNDEESDENIDSKTKKRRFRKRKRHTKRTSNMFGTEKDVIVARFTDQPRGTGSPSPKTVPKVTKTDTDTPRMVSKKLSSIAPAPRRPPLVQMSVRNKIIEPSSLKTVKERVTSRKSKHSKNEASHESAPNSPKPKVMKKKRVKKKVSSKPA